jgi:hypothetical protein
MKTLLIPTLTLAFACLPAGAQEIATPGGLPPATPSDAIRQGAAPSVARPGKTPEQIEEVDKARVKAVDELAKSPLLPNPVHLDGTRLSDLIDDLNARLTNMGETPLNVVAEPELESYPVPAMTLQNVSATDVLNVVAKVTGLKLEPVPSDSGKVAAWIVTRRKPNGSLAGMMGSFAGGGGGAESAPGSGAYEGSATPAPAALPPPTAEAAPEALAPSGLPSGAPGSFAGGAGSAMIGGGGPGILRGGGGATWEDPTATTPPPARVSRVLGIAKIYEDIANPDERAKVEDQLARTLDKLAAEQNLECHVRLYGELQVIVVKGPADGVALIEQTVTALKENAETKKPASGGSKFSSGIGTKP